LRKWILFSSILASSLAPQLHANATYSYQDGTLTDTLSLAFGGSAVDIWAANQFFTVPGAEQLTSVTVAFGPSIVGLPFSVLVYNDLNGAGLPDSLQLIKRVDSTFPAYNPPPGSASSFYTANFLSPVALGSSFFVALFLPNAPAVTVNCESTNCVPAVRIDGTAPHYRSWLAYSDAHPGTLDPANPLSADFPPDHVENAIGVSQPFVDFMITAEGEPLSAAATPEPSSGLMAIGGLAVAAWLKRRNTQLTTR
jgi:hypothetical protein